MRLAYFASPYELLDVNKPGHDRQFTKEGTYNMINLADFVEKKKKRKIHSLTDNDCCHRLKLNSKFSKLKLIRRQCRGVVSQCRT